MKIKNEDVKLFAEFIIQIPLKGKKGRLRTRLFNLLYNHIENVLNKESNDLIKEYAILDDKGNHLFSDEEKTNFLMHEDFYIEMSNLVNEKLIIENNESNKEMLINICEVLMNDELDMPIFGQLALAYDKWYEECEATVLFYEKNEKGENYGI